MIVFQTIKWKNFLSTGNNFTEVDLGRKGTTLIIGENGAGKSTILDALTFALFGKPFRKINKPGLVNSVNKKEAVVELTFTTLGKDYRIVRTLKPDTFEIYCNGTLLNKTADTRDYQTYLEKSILKMNYKSFTQIVILGAAKFTPFMQLKPADRRIVIEDLLDSQIFSVMLGIVKKQSDVNKENIEKTRVNGNALLEKKKYIKNTIESLRNNDAEKIKELSEKKDKILGDIENHKQVKLELEEKQTSLSSEIANRTKLHENHKTLISLQAKIENNKARHIKDSKFFHDTDNCPTCRQIIETEFKSEIIAQNTLKIEEYSKGLDQLKLKLDEVIDKIAVVDAKVEDFNETTAKIRSIKTSIAAMERNVAEIDAEISTLGSSSTLITDSIAQLDQVNEDIKTLSDLKEKLLQERAYIDVALNLLKDGGIKTKIIKQYLPIMNKLINKYLAQMGFFVNFTIDEQFEESIKSRFRDDFAYGNFSEGEKMRIDIALLLTWRQIARIRNSVSTNLLILDEIFDGSLDAQGTEEFLKIMMELIGDTNTFVISHKVDSLIDKFDYTYRFKKTKNYSVLVDSTMKD